MSAPPRLRLNRAILLLLAVLLWVGPELPAGGPLIVDDDGDVPVWPTNRPITLNLDRGALGALSDQEARELIESAVAEWNGVETSTLRLAIGADLRSDIEDLSTDQFEALIVRNDGTNPVIFDANGSTFDAIFGEGNNVLAVAGPSLTQGGRIIKGYALFNGGEAGAGSFETFRAVVTHEVGHFLNLDHTQINGAGNREEVGFGPPPETDITTMFPILQESTLVPHPMATLHLDDRRALSSLYPSTLFRRRPTISGFVFDFDGESPLRGLNVIVRNVDDPFADASSSVSGTRVIGDSGSDLGDLAGAFELRGLTPGASYVIYIEEVFRGFTSGSSLGPLDPPLDADTTSGVAFLEFWNGVSESARNPPDDPRIFSTVVLQDGEDRRLDFIFNGVLARPESVAPPSGSFLEGHPVTIRGVNFADTLSVNLEGPGVVPLRELMEVDSNTLTGTVPRGLIPGTYRIRVVTRKGISEDGDAAFDVTEPPPVVDSVSPNTVQNNQNRLVSLIGESLLGAISARLVRNGFPTVELSIAQRTSSNRIVVAIPAGALPGQYNVIVENTGGESVPSATPLFVLELAPALTGETSPASASNARDVDVTVFGENLAGTTMVELVLNDERVPLVIVATALDRVIVSVPGGLDVGTYLVQLTNSMNTTSGPATFMVRRPSGGGGGCSASLPADGAPGNLPFLLGVILLIMATRSLHRQVLGRQAVVRV